MHEMSQAGVFQRLLIEWWLIISGCDEAALDEYTLLQGDRGVLVPMR